MTAPARTAAYRALRAIAANRADLPSALVASRAGLPDERDRALTAEIVTGTLRWLRNLDHLIEHFARRPVAKIDGEVVAILRLSLYQLLHLQRVPASAVVDDAVNLVRQAKKVSATGFVNAVLRATLRQRHRLSLPPRPEDRNSPAADVAYLGITHSHPEWLVSRWYDRYGFEAAEQWVRFNNDTPHLTLRANRLRIQREALAAALTAERVETQPTRYAPDGLHVVRGNPLGVPNEGRFFVQDEASQVITVVLGARPGEQILDLCASPGGKTAAIAADMSDAGLVAACDVRPRRLRLLQQTVRASRATCVRVVHVGTDGALPFAVAFDRVLIDAPCSGLGTIRRDPDIRWRRAPSDLVAFARDQLSLLTRAADVVKPGGRLLYATCSSEPEENDCVVDAFLARDSRFEPVDLRPEAEELSPLMDGRGRLKTLPFAHRLEAFFAAAVRRVR